VTVRRKKSTGRGICDYVDLIQTGKRCRKFNQICNFTIIHFRVCQYILLAASLTIKRKRVLVTICRQSVCRSVCLHVGLTRYCGKMADWIWMPFGLVIGRARYGCIRRGDHPTEEQFWG